jgi:hypothetical protein
VLVKNKRQKAEGRRQKAENRTQKAEHRKQKAEGEKQETEDHCCQMKYLVYFYGNFYKREVF